VGGLKVQPETRIDAETAAEANSRVGGDVAAPANDVADPAGNADRLREGARRKAQGLHIFPGENFAEAGASSDKLDEGFSMLST
jgi:hypothetical protein